MNFLTDFPEEKVLLETYTGVNVFDLDGHIHTPYSFSAFESIAQVFDLAKKEGIKAVGINDFIVTDGYEEFHHLGIQNKVFPLFNIEFMGLLPEEKAAGIRINDPSNPGRIYFSGKGLDFPTHPTDETRKILHKVKAESNSQTAEMVEKLSSHLVRKQIPFQLTFEEIKSTLAKDLVRERHIAKALRMKVFEGYQHEEERREVLSKIFGRSLESSLENISALENEIRSRLLKKGGEAFVEEDEQAFLKLNKVIEIILDLGGIPCYPVLLDDSKGNLTEFESDYQKLLDALVSKNIFCIELIPGRNDKDKLKEFVRFFRKENFVITLGTEHNTPDLIPLTIDCRGHVPLDDELKRVNYEGASVIAAHQYLRVKSRHGYIDQLGRARREDMEYFRKLGNAIFNFYFNA